MKSLLAFLATLSFATAALAQDEPQAFNAFAVSTAQGTIVPSGDKQATMVGTVKGLLFVETAEGPVEAGTVSCAASLRLDFDTRHQAGNGACTFTAADGAAAWGDWQCEGYELVGCRGKLTLNGGSGRLQGVSGEGAMTWRPSARALQHKPDGASDIAASGILIWRDFKLAKK